MRNESEHDNRDSMDVLQMENEVDHYDNYERYDDGHNDFEKRLGTSRNQCRLGILGYRDASAITAEIACILHVFDVFERVLLCFHDIGPILLMR